MDSRSFDPADCFGNPCHFPGTGNVHCVGDILTVFEKLSRSMAAYLQEEYMSQSKSAENEKEIDRDQLADLLNEDLSREYQAIIAYVVYSQVLKGAAFMNIADQLQIHAKQEL